MSGGSYNYLFSKSPSLILETCQSELQEMADRLAGLGYAKDAAYETQALLLQLRQFENRIQASIDRLSTVWKAVEWTDSGDSGEESIKEALTKYRQEQP